MSIKTRLLQIFLVTSQKVRAPIATVEDLLAEVRMRYKRLLFVGPDTGILRSICIPGDHFVKLRNSVYIGKAIQQVIPK